MQTFVKCLALFSCLYLMAGSETAHACKNGEVESCDTVDGPGQRTCENNSWPPCRVSAAQCESGWIFTSNKCVWTGVDFLKCTDGETRSCKTAQGRDGEEYCSGGAWGRCTTSGPLAPADPSQVSDPLALVQKPSRVEPIREVEEHVLKKATEEIASSSSGEQITSQKEAEKVSRLGANYSATLGAIYCAEGANKALDDPGSAAQDLSNCQVNVNRAKQLNGEKEWEEYAPLVNSDGTTAILDDFEKNYGMNRKEYLSKFLGAKGSRMQFGEWLSEKLDPTKFKEATLAADSLPVKAQESFVVEQSKRLPASQAPASTLRNQLRESLKEKSENSADEIALEEKEIGQDIGKLAPISTKEFFGSSDENSSELTIFDVIRRKITDVARRQKLHKYR